MNYDAVAAPANIDKDRLHEEETEFQKSLKMTLVADTMEQDNDNDDIVTSAEIVLEYSDKSQREDVRLYIPILCLHFW